MSPDFGILNAVTGVKVTVLKMGRWLATTSYRNHMMLTVETVSKTDLR